MKPAVFFDRDGVLVKAPVVDSKPMSARTVQDLEIIDEMIDLISYLGARGILTFMVTNQPDISRGLLLQAEFDAQTTQILKHLNLTDVGVCPHDDVDQCSCRKPKAGMVLELARRHKVDLSRSVLVGDRWRDIEAGARANIETVFIDYHYAEIVTCEPTWRVQSPREAVAVVKEWADRLEVSS